MVVFDLKGITSYWCSKMIVHVGGTVVELQENEVHPYSSSAFTHQLLMVLNGTNNP